MSHHGAHFVKCPFYHSHDSNRIVCEGVSAGNTINLVYEKPRERSQWMSERCNNIVGCRGCPIHALLDKKYAEDKR